MKFATLIALTAAISVQDSDKEDFPAQGYGGGWAELEDADTDDQLAQVDSQSWWKSLAKKAWNHRAQIAKAAKLAYAHRNQIRSVLHSLWAQKDEILVQHPEMEELMNFDPENATLEEMESWWSKLKSVAKFAYAHR